MEKEGPWGKYVCFFSTGINPKTRAAQEELREIKATKMRQRNWKKKKKVSPKAFAKPQKPEKPQQEGSNKGKGKGAHKGTGKGIAPAKKPGLRTCGSSNCDP